MKHALVSVLLTGMIGCGSSSFDQKILAAKCAAKKVECSCREFNGVAPGDEWVCDTPHINVWRLIKLGGYAPAGKEE
jgi:hypothetical protein